MTGTGLAFTIPMGIRQQASQFIISSAICLTTTALWAAPPPVTPKPISERLNGVRCSEFFLVYDFVAYNTNLDINGARKILEDQKQQKELADKWGPLARVRDLQEKKDPSILQQDQSTNDLLLAFAELPPASGVREYNVGEHPSQLLRLIGLDRLIQFQSKNPNSSPLNIFGVDTMRAWKSADDYLNSIPPGQFRPNLQMIVKVGNMSGKTVGVLPTGFSLERGLEFNRGSFKAFPNIGRDPLTKALTEDQYISLKNNPWIHGFYELPFPLSRKGARRGAIIYALPWEVQPKLQKLVDWYNDNKTKMDPIRLAAEFQRAFVSIHPFVDGNGRASRLLMDRILAEFGLPHSLVLDHNNDIYLSPEAYEKVIRTGVVDSLNMLKLGIDTSRNPWDTNGSLIKEIWSSLTSINDKGLQDRLKLIKDLNAIKAYRFQVGKHRLRFDGNGFFYDQFNIPFEYHRGTFYPIADRSIPYYDFGGELASGIILKDRSFSDLRKQLLLKHLNLVDSLISKEESTDLMLTADISVVSKANSAGKPHIYPWQEASFAEQMKVRSEDHIQTLAPYGANAITTTDYRGTNGKNLSSAIAQYERMDLDLAELQSVTSRNSHLWRAIRLQREELHRAGRKFVDEFQTDLTKLSPTEIEFIRKDFRYKFLIEYLKISKLYHKTFADAENAGATSYVPLLRSANAAGTTFGFIPTKVWGDIAKSIPGTKNLVEWANDQLQKLSKSPETKEKKIDELLAFAFWLKPEAKKALKDKLIQNFPLAQMMLSNISRGLFLDYRVHEPQTMVGERFKQALVSRANGGDHQYYGISFSTNPAMYFYKSTFGLANTPKDVKVYLVQAPLDSVRMNHMSSYISEFEVIGIKPILPNAKVKAFTADDRTTNSSAYAPNQAVMDFMNNRMGVPLGIQPPAAVPPAPAG
jgi:hypothetical protein